MDEKEYQMKRQTIIEKYIEEISEHESAGEFGDAENMRKLMRIELDGLKQDKR